MQRLFLSLHVTSERGALGHMMPVQRLAVPDSLGHTRPCKGEGRWQLFSLCFDIVSSLRALEVTVYFRPHPVWRYLVLRKSSTLAD